MKHHHALVLFPLGCLLLLTNAICQEPASKPATFTGPRFAVARGGKLRGLPDTNAPALRDLKPGEPLVAVGKQDKLYEVEVPGGYPAWVWAAYTREGKESGTVEILEDGVNLRPKPDSDTRAVPVARLNKGKSLVMVGRQGDWIQVAAPEEIHAYVLTNDLDVTDDLPQAHEAQLTTARKWIDDLRAEAVQRESARKVEAARQAKEDVERREALRRQAAARQKCAEGLDLLRGYPDVATREKAAAILLDAERLASQLSPKDGEAILADVKRGGERLETLAFHEREKREEQERLEREAKEVERRADAAIASAQAAIDRHGNPKPVDAFGARFAGNGLGVGWLRRELELTRGRVFRLEKGGRLLFYVTCSSGKYDLESFLNREVGLVGQPKSVEGYPVRVVDVDRIEVLANFPG